jgi:RND family efflux transporter MFP subunit
MCLRHPWPRVTGLLAFVSILALGCGDSKPQLAETSPQEVIVARPLKQKVADADEYPGRLKAINSVSIQPRVSGYITAIYFKDGQYVSGPDLLGGRPLGDKLFEIDPRPYKADFDVTQAQIRNAEALITQYRAEVDRNRRLDAERAGTQEALEKAVSNLGQAQASHGLAEAQAARQKLNVDWTLVTAPFSGRVSNRKVSLGDLVDPTTKLVDLVSLDPIYVYFDVDQSTIQRYRHQAEKGENPVQDVSQIAKAKIPIDIKLSGDKNFRLANPEDVENGLDIIDFVDPQVTTGTVPVRAILANPKKALAPGFTATVRVRSATPYEAILVAERAILTLQEERYVLVVNPETNVAERRVVELGRLFGQARVIQKWDEKKKTGLKGDELVIIEGVQYVRPGEKVTMHDGKMPEPVLE